MYQEFLVFEYGQLIQNPNHKNINLQNLQDQDIHG